MLSIARKNCSALKQTILRKRNFATKPSSEGGSGLTWVLGAVVAGGLGYGAYQYQKSGSSSVAVKSTAIDYQEVAKDVAGLLEKDLEYDGLGHYGPILVRLAWHSAGTYDKATNTGGSDGGTMRHMAEAGFGANKGLEIARSLLEPLKAKYGDALSYGDLWTLAGVVAIKEMGGPSIPWRPGRTDKGDTSCPPDGRLPDATKGAPHIREVFYRMGFNDQEIVALSGAHVLGKCHPSRSGFKGPWTFAPTSFNNGYFTELLGQKWIPKKTDTVAVNGKETKQPWKGPLQYVDAATESIMMLPTDMALIQDKKFRPFVEAYAKDQEQFFADFSQAFSKLMELGCPEKVTKATPLFF